MKEFFNLTIDRFKVFILNKIWPRLRGLIVSPPVWIKRLLVYGIISFCALVAITIWNTYHVAMNNGWHSLPEGVLKPIIAYPGYSAIPRDFWFLIGFMSLFCIAYVTASRRWMLCFQVLTFPSRLYLKCHSGGKPALILLGLGLLFGLVWGYITTPPIAGITGLLILLLTASAIGSWSMVALSLLWWKINKFAKRKVKQQIFRDNNVGVLFYGVGLGLIIMFLASASLPLIYLVALVVTIAVQIVFDRRVRSIFMLLIGSATVLSLIDLIDPMLAYADDAGFYEDNMTLDGVRNWMDNRDSQVLIDASRDAGSGVITVSDPVTTALIL